MSVALDIGAWRLRSLRTDGTDLIGRSCRAVYTALPDTGSHRAALQRLGISFAVCERNLVLMGDAAVDASQLFHVPCTPLLPSGQMPSKDPPARQVLALLIEALLPKPQEANEICCLTLPGGKAAKRKSNRELAFFTRLVQLRGYRPLVLSNSMSLVLAEMAGEAFSGLGITFGAATSELSLAHRGIELFHTSTPRGGLWMDEQLALETNEFSWDVGGNRYLDSERFSQWKNDFSGSILQPTNDREELFTHLVQTMVRKLLRRAGHQLLKVAGACNLPQPMRIVLGGGSAQIPGLATLLRQSLGETSFPLEVEDVCVATDVDYAVARGCLISAELETQTVRAQSSAA